MSYIEFDNSKPLDVIPIGRIAIDFNPTDMNKPLSESSNFNKYVGGSPANIAVGLARLGAKCGFIARVSDDQFGDYVENYFKADGIDVSHVSAASTAKPGPYLHRDTQPHTEQHSDVSRRRCGSASLC